MRLISLPALVLLLAPRPAAAQIDLPTHVPAHTPIVATLRPDVPAGAQLRGTVDLIPSDRARALPVDDGRTLHIWAAPGTFTLRVSGIWVLTREVQINEETVPVLVDFGFYDHSATCLVGDQPEPEPDPEPDPPPGPRWALIVEETQARTPAQWNLYETLRRDLPISRLLIVDRDSRAPALAPYLDALTDSDALPRLFVVDAATGRILRHVPLPPTAAAVQAELTR